MSGAVGEWQDTKVSVPLSYLEWYKAKRNELSSRYAPGAGSSHGFERMEIPAELGGNNDMEKTVEKRMKDKSDFIFQCF